MYTYINIYAIYCCAIDFHLYYSIVSQAFPQKLSNTLSVTLLYASFFFVDLGPADKERQEIILNRESL